MTDIENAFGYNTLIPENIREIFMWLCQDVAALQSKWDFYLELYSDEETTSLLSELASWSFNMIEESLRNDMTMAICRLSDPSITFRKENLSLASLVEKCPDIEGLEEQLADFQVACEPISQWRNRNVGHKDYNTAIRPRENPLPGISKSQIDEIVRLAARLLQTVSFHFGGGDLYFHTVARGGGDDLVFWLKAGREHHSGTHR